MLTSLLQVEYQRSNRTLSPTCGLLLPPSRNFESTKAILQREVRSYSIDIDTNSNTRNQLFLSLHFTSSKFQSATSIFFSLQHTCKLFHILPMWSWQRYRCQPLCTIMSYSHSKQPERMKTVCFLVCWTCLRKSCFQSSWCYIPYAQRTYRCCCLSSGRVKSFNLV